MKTFQDDSELKAILTEIATSLSEIKSPSSGSKETDFLTVKEASQYLNVSISLLRKWLFRNQIKPVRLGRCIRFNRKDLDKWITEKNK
jgi:excisionase family DNA binding protein